MKGKKFLKPALGETIENLNKRYSIQFDLYEQPFRNGKGGTAVLLNGGSRNGKSNYFPRYSPDGKWIVFCQSRTGLVLQPDSELYVIPSQGGKARRLRCNTGRMNSWHSFTPNGRWIVFSSKAMTPYTEVMISHFDTEGQTSPPVALMRFNREGYAANIPETIHRSDRLIKKMEIQLSCSKRTNTRVHAEKQ